MKLLSSSEVCALAILVLSSLSNRCWADICNPVESCLEGQPGTKVVDPKDCHNYYVCIEDSQGNLEPSDNSFECQRGYYFDSYYQNCEYGTCENTCINICIIACTDYMYERIADSYNCSVFYVCTPEGAIKATCPSETPYFDGNDCTANEFVCCNACSPYCYTEYTEVQDPYDCHSYYICTDVGIPPEENHFQCGDGMFFDPATGDCQFEGPNYCRPLCTANHSTESRTSPSSSSTTQRGI